MTTNIWDEMDNPTQPTQFTFGQLMLEGWFCILQKGIGKVPFDPNFHSEGQKRAAIDMCVTPLAITGATFQVERNTIATADDWLKITLPSIHALGMKSSQLNGKYVQIELVPSGTYEKNGETKTKTAIKFVRVFNSQNECEAVYLNQTGNGHTATATPPPDAFPLDTGAPAPAPQADAGLPMPLQLAFAKTIVGNTTDIMALHGKLTQAGLSAAVMSQPEIVALIAQKWPA
jgi:hypothetical protein